MLEPRSYLFVPAAKKKMIHKAMGSEADVLIIDLEDSVATSEKQTARENVIEALYETERNQRIYIRINALDTPFWEEDLACALQVEAAGIVLPKAEDAEMMKAVADHFDTERLIPLIETAKGVQFAYDIAVANPKVERLAFGSLDYALDIGCQLTPGGQELLFARSQLVNASRAANIGAPVDTVYPDLNNEEGFVHEAKMARQLGMRAKLLIHPKQIEATHRIFSPSEEEVEEYKEIVARFEAAEQEGIASIAYNGRMIDYPVYQQAKQALEKV
ncbi:HpcH/HpaI aldolase/citrate lyase family protein [Thalassobacillus hwangdonensis]|uniref:HpcH/HpaI aldolase/citrate lyase family protein n=1 Tax=Thalassobacillus hwangdonensis TaxID=546108 RepID=A0ABW3L379_9BACI